MQLKAGRRILAVAMLGMKFVSTHATMLADTINHVSEFRPLPRTTPMQAEKVQVYKQLTSSERMSDSV